MKNLKRASAAVLLMAALSVSMPVKAAAETNPDPYQRILIVLLYPHIDEAIKEYYGELIRGYDLYDAKISSLESLYGWSKFNVTVEVETFYGAHNPPKALEIMTFYVALGEKPVLVNYEHVDTET